MLFLDAADSTTSPWFLVGLVVALLSDIFDGVIARRIGLVSPRLREADGHTDVWFYAWVGASAWWSHRPALPGATLPILLMLGAQLLAWLVDWLKYHRFSNYHAYTAKLWGITLFVATVALFGFDRGGRALLDHRRGRRALRADEIAMTLATWTCDVPSVFHARWLQAQARAAAATAVPSPAARSAAAPTAW